MAIDDLTLSRALHVASIVGWIGGVWFVTFVVCPAIRRSTPPDDRLHAFHGIEQGFAPIARMLVLLAGASGFWMTYRADLWWRYGDLHYWWMHAMTALWALFFLILFVAEPLVVHRRMKTSPDPASDFAKVERVHRILSLVALVTVLGAMGGAHGLF